MGLIEIFPNVVSTPNIIGLSIVMVVDSLPKSGCVYLGLKSYNDSVKNKYKSFLSNMTIATVHEKN